VTVTNISTATFNVPTITLAGVNPSEYTQSHACTSAISPNGTCTINVSFKPTQTGNRTAEVKVEFPLSAAPVGAPSVLASQFIRALTAADITNSSTQKFWSANSHIYEFVSGSSTAGASYKTMSWASALSAASTRTLAGRNGHLVTISSDQERAFIATTLMAPADTARDWLAIAAKKTNGAWRHASGPENNSNFYLSSLSGGTGYNTALSCD
jgi:hypothetical protein